MWEFKVIQITIEPSVSTLTHSRMQTYGPVKFKCTNYGSVRSSAEALANKQRNMEKEYDYCQRATLAGPMSIHHVMAT